MAETNSDNNGVDDADQVAEDELRKAKYPEDSVDSDEEDETTDGDDSDDDADDTGEDDDKIEDDAEDDDSEEEADTDSDDEDSEFVKEFSNIKGDTLVDYVKGLETAYKNSSAEALRLKRELDTLKAKDSAIGENDDDDDSADDTRQVDNNDPLRLWAKQSLDKEIDGAFQDFSKIYPSQVADATEYDKFTKRVAVLSRTIMESEGRLAPPRELYTTAAVSLGWEADDKVTSNDKLKVAIKDRGSTSKTRTGPSKKAPKSKVSDKDVAVFRKMNPSDDKSDADIRKELEVYA